MHHVWNDNSKHIFSETIFLTLVEAYNDNVLNDIWIDTAITNKQKKTLYFLGANSFCFCQISIRFATLSIPAAYSLVQLKVKRIFFTFPHSLFFVRNLSTCALCLVYAKVDEIVVLLHIFFFYWEIQIKMKGHRQSLVSNYA